MSREAMQMALEALVQLDGIDTETECVTIDVDDVITAIKEALAQPEQEPVAWASTLDFDDDDIEIIPAKAKGKLGTSNCDIPLYATPKQWVGLTDEEIAIICGECAASAHKTDDISYARAIEAKLREKNQ